MPRLVKGGKWVYGWVIITEEGRLRLPESAQQHYGFKVGDRVFAIRGSCRSGGFGLTKQALLTGGMVLKHIAEFIVDEKGCIQLQAEDQIHLGLCAPVQLLVVRGSRIALGFVAKGPIYEEALKHQELVIVSSEEEN